MEAGDTFYLPDKAADGHLWIVISAPGKNPDRVLLVSMTSYDVDKCKEAGPLLAIWASTKLA
jgi:hypothetical protein